MQACIGHYEMGWRRAGQQEQILKTSGAMQVCIGRYEMGWRRAGQQEQILKTFGAMQVCIGHYEMGWRYAGHLHCWKCPVGLLNEADYPNANLKRDTNLVEEFGLPLFACYPNGNLNEGY